MVPYGNIKTIPDKIKLQLFITYIKKYKIKYKIYINSCFFNLNLKILICNVQCTVHYTRLILNSQAQNFGRIKLHKSHYFYGILCEQKSEFMIFLKKA